MKSTMLNRISKVLILTVFFTFCFCFGTVGLAAADDGEFNIEVAPWGDGTAIITITKYPDKKYDYVELYKSTDGGDYKYYKTFPYDKLTSGEGYGMQDSSIKFGSVYSYKIFCYSAEGSEVTDHSDFSPEVTIKGEDMKVTAFKSIKVTGTTKVKLTWTEIPKVDGYKIYKYNTSSKKYTVVKTVKGADKSSTTITGLTKNKKVSFKIATYGNGVVSPLSKAIADTPRANIFKQSVSTNVKKYKKDDVSFAIRQISYNDDKELKVKLLVVNRKSRRLSSFGSVTLKVYHDNVVIAKQTYKEMRVDLAKGKTKFMTFTFDKGTKKTGRNLRYGEFVVDYNMKYRLG